MIDWRVLMAGTLKTEQNTQNHHNDVARRQDLSSRCRPSQGARCVFEGQIVQWRTSRADINKGMVVLAAYGWLLVRTIERNCSRLVFVSRQLLHEHRL
jgi:hypothetical protein